MSTAPCFSASMAPFGPASRSSKPISTVWRNSNGGTIAAWGRATYFYVYYLYRNSFDYYRMGYGAAMAWFLFAVILVLTLFNFWFSKKWVFYEAGE